MEIAANEMAFRFSDKYLLVHELAHEKKIDLESLKKTVDFSNFFQG
jgi:hypothetical protein